MKQNIVFAVLVIVLGIFVVWSAGATRQQTAALAQPDGNDRTVTPKPTHCHGNGGNGFGDDKCLETDEPTLEGTQNPTATPLATLTPTPTETANINTPTPTYTEDSAGIATITPTATATRTPTSTPTQGTPGTPTPSHTPTPGPTVSVDQRYNGTWTVAFTLNHNTFTHEPRRYWFAWVIEIHQQGDQVTGTMKRTDSGDTGKIWGTVNSAGTFNGNMRLSWDVRDWQSISFTLNPDGSGGTGAAVYKQAESNVHYYDIQLVPGANYDPPFPYAPPYPGNPSGNYSGRWLTYFHLEENTGTGDKDHFWNAFFMDLTQNGNQVSGTLTAWDVNATGTISGTVDSFGVFNGVMRLSWDDHDWESVQFYLADNHSQGWGNAVFQAGPNEQHRYSVYLLYPSN